MTLSSYTFLFERSGEYFLFTAKSGSFFKIPKEVYDFLKGIDNTEAVPEEMQEIVSQLQKIGAISTKEEDADYLDALKHRWLLKAYQNTHLGLTLVPTEWCNLRCPYCFEKNKEAKYMDDKVIDRLIDFVKAHKAPTYSIYWYGGEPLLAIDQIEKILDRLNDLPDKKRTGHSIVTNGTLLNDRVLEVFKKYPLDHIQITFDGVKATHDTRRITHAGDGTFDLIIRNLKKLAEALPDTPINIRVNIDRLNADEFIKVKELIKETFPDKKNIGCYPGILSGDKDCSDYTLFTNETLVNFYNELREKNGIDLWSYPYRNVGGCTATGICTHVIGADGALYRCWEDVGIKDMQIGNICEDSLSNEPLLRKFLKCTPFEDDECIACKLLPVCSGGCPKKRFNNKYNNASNELCFLLKTNDSNTLFDYLISYYKMKSEQNKCNCTK